MNITLKPIGDVEVWYAEPDDGSWMLPLFIEWKQAPDGRQFALVLQGVCFYQIQIAAIGALLQTHSLEKRTDRWLLNKSIVPSLLRKAPGIHPEFYYHWPGGTHPPIPAPYHAVQLPSPEMPPPRRAEHHRTFAQFISQDVGVPADVCMIVLTGIERCGARWLIEHREVLDLGWVRLFALPFRANWKEIVMFKCRPWKLASVLRQTPRIRDALLKRLGFVRVACSVHNIALLDKRQRVPGRLDYTVEAVTTDSFERTADTVEADRQKSGQTSYVGHYEEAVESLYHQIVEALAHYVHKVEETWATVRQVGSSGVLTFLSVSRQRAKVRGLSLAELPAHIVPPVSDFNILAEAEESDPELVSAQADEVSKVRALPPPADDLRECEEPGDVGEPRPPGADGVPLPDVVEERAAGEPVLPEHSTSNGNSPRVD